MRRAAVWCLCLAGCGGGTPDPVAVEVDTFGPSVWFVGNTIPVTCLGIDADGQAYVLPEEQPGVVVAYPADEVEVGPGGLIPLTVRNLSVMCGADADHLDPTPLVIEIRAGQPATVTTTLDTTSVTAGASVTATCAVADAYGNPVTDVTPTVRAAPRATGNSTDGGVASFTRAGTYEVSCHLDGVPGDATAVTVASGLPAAVYAAIAPVEATFGIDEPVVVTPRSYDRYGNEVLDATYQITATIVSGAGPITTLGPGRYQFGSAGVYRLTATVASPTDGDIVLVDSEDVVVAAGGSSIRCLDPPHAAHVTVDDGAPITFRGATGTTGVAGVTVDGTAVAVAGDGTFTADVDARFGLNTLHVVVTDTGGNTIDRTCTFVASPSSVNANEVLPRVATLALLQGALYNVATDAGAAAPFFEGLISGLGPVLEILPEAAPRLGSTLIASVSIIGVDALPYFNAAPMEGALGIDVHSDAFALRLEIRGRQGEMVVVHQARIDFNGIDLRVVLDVVIDGSARLRALPRRDSVAMTFGDLEVSAAGDDPDVLAVVRRLAEGKIDTLVREAIRNWLLGRLPAEIDAIVGGLDLEGTEVVLAVDRIDTGAVELGYVTAADPTFLDPTHGIFRLGTAVTSNAAHGRAGAVPVIEMPGAFDPPFVYGNTVAAVHASMLGQVLHALWRAGYYDAVADSDFLQTPGASITTSMALPPSVAFAAGPSVIVDVGAIDALVSLAGIFDALPVSFSVRAAAAVDDTAGDLTTGVFSIVELTYSVGAVSLDATTRQTLEGLLASWAREVLGVTFDRGFAATPAATLAGAYGAETPVVESIDAHLVLHGCHLCP